MHSTCGLDFDVLDFLFDRGVAGLDGFGIPGQASHIGLIRLSQLHNVALDGGDLLFGHQVPLEHLLVEHCQLLSGVVRPENPIETRSQTKFY